MMRKKVSRFISLVLALCMLLTISCSAEVGGTITKKVDADQTTPTEEVITIGAITTDEDTAEEDGTTDEATEEENSLIDYASYLSEQTADKAAEGVETECDLQVSDTPATLTVTVPADGLYTLGFSYLATDSATEKLTFAVKIDGEIPFAEAEKLVLSRIWVNQGGNRVDGIGNEFAPKQVPTDKFYFDVVTDITDWTNDPYLFFLTAGEHTIEISKLYGEFKIEKLTFGSIETPEKYTAPKSDFYEGEPIIIEGEDAKIKTSHWLVGKSDTSTVDITPQDSAKSLVNYIGGGNWSTNGDTLTWETPEMKAGYYNIAFMYRQSAVLGAKVYRDLKIDGKTPFAEAGHVGFSYTYKWQETIFADENDEPYYVWFDEGKHTISLTVVPGEISEIRDLLKEATAEIGDLYIDITMITGETVDTYRDYDLFKQISDMLPRIQSIYKKLAKCSKQLQKLTGEKSGSYISIINNMNQVLQLMVDNRYTAHRYKDIFYSRYTSLASVLYEMNSMPLDLDKISLYAKDTKEPIDTPNAFASMWYSVERFFISFVQDYNNVSVAQEGAENITIWVNWGRDQAQVLNSLIQTTFTPQNPDIAVNIQLVNATVVQAILSGKGPDVLLQHSRSEPVNLAMRGVLYDMKQFKDYDKVMEQFGKDADLPYLYKGGSYGLPDTQSFYLMYYRTDIMEEMGLKVPETWEDFEEVVRLLATNNLTAWMPNNTMTSVGQANTGIGSINLFPTLMLQSGVDLYEEDGRSTNLSSSESAVIFNTWTDFYTKLRMPRTMDFYNRFRTGSCPIGISTHTMYTTLKAAAPEIDGKWSVALVPGTVREDGSINHITSGGGSACSIMKNTKNPDASWEFIKWWISADTQLNYSNEIETILGPTGRVSVSNIEAFESLQWDMEMKDTIVTAMKQIEEVPEYPGSYYVSRSVYQSFWNVVENNQNTKETLLKYSEEANVEIERKWRQYENR